MQTLIKELVNGGIEPVFCKDADGEYFWDLKSGMKSHMHLYLDKTGKGQHKIKLRYNEEMIVENLNDVKYVARKAMHGKDYASDAWHELLKQD